LSSSDLTTPPDPDRSSDDTSEPSPPRDVAAPPDPLTPPDLESSPDSASSPARPGASTFTIDGRAAPGLFVVGWLATLSGLGAVFIGILSGGTLTSTIILVVGLVLLALGLIAGSGSQGLERRARAVLPYRGPSPFLVFAAAIPVSILALLLAVFPMQALGLTVDGPFGRLVSVLLQTVVYVLLIRLLVVDVGALSWLEMGVRRLDRDALAEAAIGAAFALPVILLTVPVALILGSLFTVTPESPLPPAGEASGFVLNLIAGAILAPLGEELMFRGLATTAWVRGIGARRGIIRGALFFAVVHVLTISGNSAGEALQLALIAFATRIPVALALGALFVRRGSIWASFGLHAAFNGILLILAEAAARSGVPGAG
jgi:membrane protease YdiL (CAAX protease family)